LLKSFLKYGKGMLIEKRRSIPVNRCLVVIELDVAGAEVLVIGVLMEAEHEVPLRFDPVDAVVLVVNTGGIPEANFQSCVLNVIGFTKERYRRDICNHISGPSSRRAIAHVLATGLVRQPIVNISEERALCIPITASKEDHDTLARGPISYLAPLLACGFDIRVER
jgi:hypothetical protein